MIGYLLAKNLSSSNNYYLSIVSWIFNLFNICYLHCFFLKRPYQFRMEEIEAFRYRARDAWRAVTRIAVREARLQEIKIEMMQCRKLKVTQADKMSLS